MSGAQTRHQDEDSLRSTARMFGEARLTDAQHETEDWATGPRRA